MFNSFPAIVMLLVTIWLCFMSAASFVATLEALKRGKILHTVVGSVQTVVLCSVAVLFVFLQTGP